MKNPLLWLLLLSIPAAGCGSTSTPSGDDYDPGAAAVSEVPNVTGNRIRVEWRNLKPSRNDVPLGLINVSSPDVSSRRIYRKRDEFRGVKPIDDETMGVVLAALDSLIKQQMNAG